ncbi:hypothetical protein JTE90_010298 [Oedothorax gibbosus]|uniref:Uncharacterized protein n=1 Tax=Oedothorax gibbosus TaxID=931172 RepID=A0AAV6V4P1_9ARAC|nr:hypothetical protein JTE90_010298 [Oedothorax gibbosus]
MNSVVLVSFLALFLVASAEQPNEDHMAMLKGLFCGDNEDSKAKIDKCFSELKVSENGNKILEGCCPGLEIPLTSDSAHAFICESSTEKLMECMDCQCEEFEKEGNGDKYKEGLGSLTTCLENEFKEE